MGDSDDYNPDHDRCCACGMDLCSCQEPLECAEADRRILDWGAGYVIAVYPCQRCGGCSGSCHEVDEDEPHLN